MLPRHAVTITPSPVTLRACEGLWLRLCRLWQALHADGFRSLAVVLKHAAIFPDNEKAVGQVARELGFTQVGGTHSTQHSDCIQASGCQAKPSALQVSLSHEVMQMVKMVPRGFTATADAYLTPHIMRCAVGTRPQFGKVDIFGASNLSILEIRIQMHYSISLCGPARYITAFQGGFDKGLRNVQLSFMQSDGGLAPVDAFSGHKAILSGPAGGCAVVCHNHTASHVCTLHRQAQTSYSPK